VCIAVLAACGGSGSDGTSDGGVVANNPPAPVANCSTPPQSAAFRAFLQATDTDNNTNELTFSLDPSLSQETDLITTTTGT
jgi:hypothetical protein